MQALSLEAMARGWRPSLVGWRPSSDGGTPPVDLCQPLFWSVPANETPNLQNKTRKGETYLDGLRALRCPLLHDSTSRQSCNSLMASSRITREFWQVL